MRAASCGGHPGRDNRDGAGGAQPRQHRASLLRCTELAGTPEALSTLSPRLSGALVFRPPTLKQDFPDFH